MKPGPKARPAHENKKHVIPVRMSEDLHAALAAAAQQKKTPLNKVSREIERRLRDSFKLDADIEKHFGSERVFRLFKTIARALAGNPRRRSATGDRWLYNADKLAHAATFIAAVLRALSPPGSAKISEKRRAVIEEAAKETVRRMAIGDATDEPPEKPEPLPLGTYGLLPVKNADGKPEPWLVPGKVIGDKFVRDKAGALHKIERASSKAKQPKKNRESKNER